MHLPETHKYRNNVTRYERWARGRIQFLTELIILNIINNQI